MLPRIAVTLLRSRRRCRYYSTEVTAYHEKVCGYPFAFSPTQALEAVYEIVLDDLEKFRLEGLPFATLFGMMWHHYFVAAFGFGDRFKAYDGFRIQSVQPFYVPMWDILADVRGLVSVKGKRTDAALFVDSGSFPGHDNRYLAKIFFTAPLEGLRPASELPHKLSWTGEDVVQLPFQVSPFTIPTLMRAVPETSAHLTQDISFIPSSIRFHVFSAMPLLYPVYLIATESDTSSIKATWIVPAYHPKAYKETVGMIKPYERVEDISSLLLTMLRYHPAGIDADAYAMDFSTEHVPETYVAVDPLIRLNEKFHEDVAQKVKDALNSLSS